MRGTHLLMSVLTTACWTVVADQPLDDQQPDDRPTDSVKRHSGRLEQVNCDQLIGDISVSAPDRIRQGEPVIIIVRHSAGRVRGSRESVSASQAYIRTGGDLFMGRQTRSDLPLYAPPAEHAFQFDFSKKPGRYEVEYVVTLSVSRPKHAWHQLLCEKMAILSKELKVLGMGDAEEVRMSADHGISDRLRCYLMGTRALVIDPDTRDTVDRYGHIDLRLKSPAPSTFAFDVFVPLREPSADRKEMKVGYWYCRRNSWDIVSRMRIDLDNVRWEERQFADDSSLTVTFRSSAEIARKMIDPGEVWQGELVYDVGFHGGMAGPAPLPPQKCACRLTLHGLRKPECPLCGGETEPLSERADAP